MRRPNKRPPKNEWRVMRRETWERDKGICQGCGQPVSLRRAHCDHIEPLSEGGSNAPSNRRTLCPTCHCLRAGKAHQGMMAGALRRGDLLPGWRTKQAVWEG